MVISDLSFSFPDHPLFRSFSLNLGTSGVTAILGKSGCGKTTLFNLIAGLLTPQEGQIIGYQNDLISYVFQDPCLLPWRTSLQNLLFVWPEDKDIDSGKKRAFHLLEAAGLQKWAHAFPKALSGGMRQRLSLIRAFMNPAKVILMDEPLKGLDPLAKRNMFELLQALREGQESLILWTTHDVDEALLIADRILVLEGLPLRIAGDFLATADGSLERLTGEGQNKIRRDIYNLLLDLS
jgi:NitT/TauT family transport system ATP-binding protein